jgi:hypothetical protein
VLSSIKFTIISLKISLSVLSWHQRKTGEKTETKKNLTFSVSENGRSLLKNSIAELYLEEKHRKTHLYPTFRSLERDFYEYQGSLANQWLHACNTCFARTKE